MNHANPLPCHRALDADCFRVYPAWARRAFAYKLLHVFYPPWLTRRLPKFLRLPLIAPGVDVPPDAYFPPGTVIPPGTDFPLGWVPQDPPPPGVYIPPWTVFPPDWTPEDPLPPGVTIDPVVVYPPDWTPEDPLPPAVTVEPKTVFPLAWAPADPLPPGVTIDPSAAFPLDWAPGDLPPDSVILPTELPPEIQKTGVLPPTYIKPWEPGPTYWPKARQVKIYDETIKAYAADGAVAHTVATWGEWRNGTTGSNTSTSQSATNSGMGLWRSPVMFLGARTFLPFDLSALPPDREVLFAGLSVHGYNYNHSSVCVQEGTQGEPLHVDDWDAFTGDAFATLAWGTAWNEFEFDLWGRLYVRSKMGHTALFCLREHAHDYSNIPPAVGEQFSNGLHYSEWWGFEPKLRIIYK